VEARTQRRLISQTAVAGLCACDKKIDATVTQALRAEASGALWRASARGRSLQKPGSCFDGKPVSSSLVISNLGMMPLHLPTPSAPNV
jgi:hypothetical protein